MKRVMETMARIQGALGGILLAACLGLIIFETIGAYLGLDVSWAKRASLCTLIWGVFIESGALVYEKRHFAFGGMKEKVRGRRIAAFWDAGVSFVKLVFCVLLIDCGWRLTGGRGGGTMAEFLSFGALWCCLPVFGFTASLYLAYQLFCDVRSAVGGGEGR